MEIIGLSTVILYEAKQRIGASLSLCLRVSALVQNIHGYCTWHRSIYAHD